MAYPPEKRRAYQNEYYKSAEQRLRRAATQVAYIKRLRLRIFSRYDFTCFYCHKVFEIQELHIDHKIPLVLGGKNIDENRVAACAFCNKSKGRNLVCGSCGSFRKPELMENGHKRCTGCGAIDSYPDLMPTIPENAPPWTDVERDTDADQPGE